PDDEREALQSQPALARKPFGKKVSATPIASATTTTQPASSAPASVPASGEVLPPDPFADVFQNPERMLETLQKRWEGGGFGTGLTMNSAMSGQASVKETGRGAEIVVQVPGIDPRGMTIELTDGVVTLSARQEVDEDDPKAHRHQHFVSALTRKFKLPF